MIYGPEIIEDHMIGITIGHYKVIVLKTKLSEVANPPKETDEVRAEEGAGEMTKAVIQLKEPSDEKEKEVVKKINKALYESIEKLAKFDTKASNYRFWTVLFLATVIAGATLVLLWGVFKKNGELDTIIVGGAVVITALIIGGLMNPLQTIERDIVYRRWSDTIMYAFWSRLADEKTDLAEIKKAVEDASCQFASLATAYAAAANKNLETLSVVTAPSAGQSSAETFTIKNPGDQTSEIGKELKPGLQIQASGADDIKYHIEDPPPGLRLDRNTGLISGTPEGGKPEHNTKVTATSATKQISAWTTFRWTVTEHAQCKQSGAGSVGS